MSKAEPDLADHSAAYSAFACALAHFQEVMANNGDDNAAGAAIEALDEAAFAVLRAPYRTHQALAEKANVVELLHIEGDDLGSRAARDLAAAILQKDRTAPQAPRVIKTADQLLEALGGVDAISAWLSVPRSKVIEWRKRGVPTGWHMLFDREARRAGLIVEDHVWGLDGFPPLLVHRNARQDPASE